MVHEGQNWETKEVIRWLINNNRCCRSLIGTNAGEVRAFVEGGSAPTGFYTSFTKEPPSSYNDVDWEQVTDSMNDR